MIYYSKETLVRNIFMKKSISPFTKYNRARHNILLLFILSLINLFIFAGAQIYFLFSTYLSLVFMSVASADSSLLGIMLLLSILYLTAYLLCYIFSKRHYGWMVGTLILFGFDSLFLLLDLPSFLIMGDFSIVIDLIFHLYILILLIIGVVEGKNLRPILQMNGKKKSPSNEADPQSIEETSDSEQDGQESKIPSEETRELTIQRKKSFIGCIIPFLICVNGKVIGTLKNGQKAVFAVPACAFRLSVVLTDGSSENSIEVAEGNTPLSFETSTNTGFTSTKLELNQIE